MTRNTHCIDVTFETAIRRLIHDVDKTLFSGCRRHDEIPTRKRRQYHVMCLVGLHALGRSLTYVQSLKRKKNRLKITTKRFHFDVMWLEFYKMLHTLTSPYLSDLVPRDIRHLTDLHLRNSFNLEKLDSGQVALATLFFLHLYVFAITYCLISGNQHRYKNLSPN